MTRQVQQHTMSGNISSCISSSSSDDDEGAMSSSLSRVLVSSSAADEDEMLMVLSSSSHLRSSSTSPYGCYRDFFYKEASEIQAAYIETPKAKRRGPRGGVSVPFPVRLYDMLESVEKEQNREHVVSWLPHGRSFIVHQPEIFVSEIMPKYFNQSKLTSFQRQLNLYGFQRQSTGRDRGSYYHELFLKGRADLVKIMVRTRVKGGPGCATTATTTTSGNHNHHKQQQQHHEESLIMSSGVACGGGGEPYFYSMPPCSHDNFLRRPKGDLNHDVVVKALPMTPLSPTSNSNMNSACMSPVPASSSDNKQGQKATTSSAPRRVSTLSVVPVDHHHHEVQEQEGKTVPPRPPARLQQQQHPRTSLPPVQSSSTCCLKLSPQRRVRRAAAPHLFRQAMQKASASVPPVPMTTSPDVRYLTGRGGGGHGARQDDMVNHQQPHARYNIVPGSPLAEQQDAPNCTRNYSLLPLPPTNWSTSPSNNCMASSSSSPPPPPPFFPMCMPDMMMSAPPSSLEQQGGQANNNNNNSSRFLHHHQMTSSHAHQQTNLTPRRVSNNYMADDTCCFFEGHEFQVIDDASLEAFESAMRMHV